MIRYYSWAIVEKTLSLTPGGKRIYRAVGRAVRRNQRGTGVHIATAYPIIRKARDLAQGEAFILDVGTGWFHHDAFLLYLVAGERWQIALFDIEDRGDLRSIRNYLSYLREHSREVAAELDLNQPDMVEKLDELLALPTRERIYERCGFTLHVPSDLTRPFLPDNSFDVMVSDCVLPHIRPEVVVGELSALARMLKDDGVMYHRIGHDDHWAFHDPTIPWPSFNYLRYSDRIYRLLFDTKLEYHNRLLKSDWLRIFHEAGLRVIEYDARVSNASRDAVNRLPKIADKYVGIPEEELAVYYSYVLLGRGDAKASS